MADARVPVVQRENTIHAVHAPQDFDQPRLCPHDNFPGPLAYQRDIPDELNRVAKTVVTADEHAFTREQFAVPEILLMTRQMPARLVGAAPHHRIADPPRGVEIPAPDALNPRVHVSG